MLELRESYILIIIFWHADLLLYRLALTAHDEVAILGDSDLLLAYWIAPRDGRMDHLNQNEHGYNSVEHLSSIQIRKFSTRYDSDAQYGLYLPWFFMLAEVIS